MNTYVDESLIDQNDYVINTSAPVYITMSTIPARLPNAIKIIENFLKHVKGFEKIILNVPYEYRRWPHLRVEVPNFTNDPRYILNRCEDYGPMTKFLPSLAIVPDHSILIIRDDMCYKNEAFVDIAEKQDKYRNHAFSFFVYDYFGVKIPQGADLISCYTKNLRDFPNWFQEFMSANKMEDYYNSSCFFVDDQVLGWYFKILDIPLLQYERTHRNIYIRNCEVSDESQNLNKQTGSKSRDTVMKSCWKDMNDTFKEI